MPPADDTSAPLAGYRVDVFWCDESGEKAEALAHQVRAQIDAGTKVERVRVRKLTYGQGPWASGYEVRVDPDGSEDRAGRALQRFLAARHHGLELTGWKAESSTPNYLSVFLCPGTRSNADLDARTRYF